MRASCAGELGGVVRSIRRTFCLRPVCLSHPQRLLLSSVALRQSLRLRLMLLLKRLVIYAAGRLLRSACMIGGLLLLQCLPLLFLAIVQGVQLLLIDLVAVGISGTGCRLVGNRRQVCRMHGKVLLARLGHKRLRGYLR